MPRCSLIRPFVLLASLALLASGKDDGFDYAGEVDIPAVDWDKEGPVTGSNGKTTRGWECSQVFEGHTHYVMLAEFNPKDINTFASASLDRTVKVWGLTSPTPHYSLEGHERYCI